MSKRKFQIETCKFIPVSSLVPENWDWFFALISENAPFSWGDNNRTMIDVDTFLNHCDDAFDFDSHYVNVGAYKAWVKKIERIPKDVYIDMEN